MATTIQLLRSDIAQQRPDPGVLANGTPMVNLNEREPGLFFSDRVGSLFKVGPTAVGDDVPNISPEGEPGNSKGETWLDTSGPSPVLKIYDGGEWVTCFDDPGGTVTSVGLTFSSIFDVSGTPITTSGTFSATLRPQIKSTVFAGPDAVDGTPSFRALVANDIPALPATKITTGQLDSGRVPSLDASKITTGVFSQDRIPSLNASKITNGSLSFTVGGTGITSTPGQGEVLIGTGLGWVKNTLTPGANIGITNGVGAVSVSVSDTPSFSSLALRDGAGDTLTLAAPNVSVSYTLNLPASDGPSGALLCTDGGGQLSFVTSLFGLGSIGGANSLTINAGGANGSVILAPTGSGAVSVSSSRITNLATPVDGSDATTKSYVDSISAGLQPKSQVAAASTANIDLATGGELTIDTVPLVSGQRVLVKDQLLPEENGIYNVGLGAWTRSSDADTFAKLVNATVFVASGATNVGTTFLCDSPASGNLGIDPVNWVIFSSGLGTVTSVGLSLPAELTVSNSPVVSSGTLTATYVNQAANTVFAGPAGGGAATPAFRALTAGDIPFTLSSHTFVGAATFQAAVTLGNESADTITVNGAATFKATASFNGAVVLGDSATDLISINGSVDTNIIPSGTVSLGGPDAGEAWANVYTNDLHLSNEGHANDVDGTWGKYTVQEGEEDLFLINRRTGKRYKFLLQEV